MQIINIRKIKILIAAAVLVILIIILSAVISSGRKKKKTEESPVLQQAPENIIKQAVFMKDLKQSDARYYIDAEGNLIIRDKDGREFLLTSDGKIYEITNGVRTAVSDGNDMNFITEAFSEAAENSSYVNSMKKKIEKESSKKNENTKKTAVSKERSAGQNSESLMKTIRSSTSEPQTKPLKTNINDDALSYDSIVRGLSGNNYESQNAQSSKLKFSRNFAELSGDAELLSENDIAPGTIIPVTLITGVNSDLPGEIIAQTNINIYDTLTRSKLLLPKGTKLMATYDSQISWGQERILVAWTTVVRSDGLILHIPGFQGVDNLGRTGYAGNVNNHFWKILGSAGLSSLIDVGSASIKNLSDSIALDAVFESIADTSGDVGKELIEKAVNRQPTITIAPGKTARVLINRKITVPDYLET